MNQDQKMKCNVISVLIAVFLFAGCSSTEQRQGDTENQEGQPVTREQADRSGPGCMEGDCQNGNGVYLYENGDRYTGRFENGKRHGEGFMNYDNGDAFEGRYTEDRRSGHGRYVFESGAVYEGEFRNGLREGEARYTFPDGRIFVGEFVADGREGVGLLLTDNSPMECELENKIMRCLGVEIEGQADENTRIEETIE